jgi:hypothetical protein
MHQQIRHSLEDFLRGGSQNAKFQAHLGECAECANELQLLQRQSQMLQALRSGAEVEPRAGFYARVVERIQSQPASIWSVFLERRFGFRLAVASAALVALLGAYLITSEANGPEFASAPAVASSNSVASSSSDTLRSAETTLQEDGPHARQQRDAVLVDLASYRQ